MIYSKLPANCRFYSVTNEVFALLFIKYYEIYLKTAGEYYLEVMEEATTDGDRLKFAEVAKKLHEYKELELDGIASLFTCVMKYEYLHPEHKVLLKSIPLTNCQFNFWDYSCKNLQLAHTIWNAVKEDFGIDKDEDDELEFMMPDGSIMVC